MVFILVCYGGEYGFDFEYVVCYYNIIFEEVISIYFEGEYLVYMIGFVFGFLFFGGLFEKIVMFCWLFFCIFIFVGLVGIVGM